MKATYDPHAAYPDPPVIRRFWTRATFWNDGSTVDNPAACEADALRAARENSLNLRADVDAMDEANVLATYRQGKEV